MFLSEQEKEDLERLTNSLRDELDYLKQDEINRKNNKDQLFESNELIKPESRGP